MSKFEIRCDGCGTIQMHTFACKTDLVNSLVHGAVTHGWRADRFESRPGGKRFTGDICRNCLEQRSPSDERP